MPDRGDCAALIARARDLDAEAFAELVARAEPVLLPGAAAVVGSVAQLQAAVRCSVCAMRQGLATCPGSAMAFTHWVEAQLLGQLDVLVPRALRPGTPQEDALSRLVAQAGLQALRQDAASVLVQVRGIRAQLAGLPAADQALLDARYRQGHAVEVLARMAERDATVIAEALCRVRDALDPQASGDVPTPVEALALEHAITARPGADERDRILADIAGDGRLLGLLVRQSRLHLVLLVLLLPEDRERTRRLAATVGVTPATAYPDDGAVVVAEAAHHLDSQVTFGAVPAKGRKGSSDQQVAPRARPTPRPGGHGQADSLSLSIAHLERSQRQTMRVIMLGILGVGLLVLGILWWSTAEGRSRQVPVPPPPVVEPAAAAAPVVGADPQPHRTRSAPSPAAPRFFLYGVNFGGEPVHIDRQSWMSGGQLQEQGVVITGRSVDQAIGRIGGECDLERQRMLACGLTGIGGMVRILQELPNALCEVTLWFANPQGFTGEQVRISTGGEAMSLPPVIGNPPLWRQVGPVPISSMGGQNTFTITGMRAADHLAGMVVQVVGGLEGNGAPLRIVWPKDGSRLSGVSPMTLCALPAVTAGPLSGLGFRITDEQAVVRRLEGSSLRWSPEALGTLRVVATARQADGSTVESTPVRIEVTYEGAMLQQWWYGLGLGKSLDALRNDPRFPDRPDRETLLDSSWRNPDCGGDFHGRRIRGYLIPPQDGAYDFGMCADNGCEVHLSTDASSANKRKILGIAHDWVDDGQWDRFPGQKAQHIPLKAGQRYYCEVLHHQEDGREVLHLGWTRPDGVVERPIPLKHFMPLRMPETFPQRIARLAVPADGCPLDRLDGATLACSTRRLRSAYTGPLVELRRAQDGQVKTWLPDGRGWLSAASSDGAGATLGAWKGDGVVRVVRWFDQSGNGFDARAPDEGHAAGLEGSGPYLVAFDGRQRLVTPELTTQQWAGPGRHNTLTIVSTLRFRSGAVIFQALFPQDDRIGIESMDFWDYPCSGRGRMGGWSRSLLDRLQVAAFQVAGDDRQARINLDIVHATRWDRSLRDGKGTAGFGAQPDGDWSSESAIGEFILFPRALDQSRLLALEASQAQAFAIVP